MAQQEHRHQGKITRAQVLRRIDVVAGHPALRWFINISRVAVAWPMISSAMDREEFKPIPGPANRETGSSRGKHDLSEQASGVLASGRLRRHPCVYG